MAVKQPILVQHVVAVPYPAQGHINPLLQLCHQLVPHGFTFTFVNTHHIHRRVQDANSHGSDNVELDGRTHQDRHQTQKGQNPVRMVFVEGGCAPEVHAHISGSKEASKAAQTMKEPVEQLISNILEEQPVAFILTDILLGWSEATASKFGLPWVCFWAASAATCSALIHLADLGQQGMSIPITDKEADAELLPILAGIPGLPPTRLHDIPKAWDDRGKLYYELVLKYFHSAQKASFLLLNTFAELEGQVVEALISKGYATLGVGPLLPSRYIRSPDTTARLCKEVDGDGVGAWRANLFTEDRSCLEWLDKQATSSVLFISFGSISARTEQQLEELAHAVEASGCPFLWVRKPDISADFTPGSGIQHRGNGLIVPWAPQLDVLSHRAVGGFITHCGWNSVIESVAMGVPMLCWADTGERMSNQRFVVQLWKCGIHMVSDDQRYTQHIDEAVLVKREEIEKSIRCLMLEEAGTPFRNQATHLRDSALIAFDDAHSQFDHFVEAMQNGKTIQSNNK